MTELPNCELRGETPKRLKMQQTDKHITELLRAYLERWRDLGAAEVLRDRIRPQNIEMTIFIVNCTVESLCHSAVIEHPQFLSDSQFEQEVSNLLISYLLTTPLNGFTP